jgi:hypothetical protein
VIEEVKKRRSGEGVEVLPNETPQDPPEQLTLL